MPEPEAATPEAAEKRFFVSYTVEPHPEGVTKEELGDRGGCDAAIIITITRTPTGMEVVPLVAEGDPTFQRGPARLFEGMVLLAQIMAQDTQTPQNVRAFCTNMLQALQPPKQAIATPPGTRIWTPGQQP